MFSGGKGCQPSRLSQIVRRDFLEIRYFKKSGSALTGKAQLKELGKRLLMLDRGPVRPITFAECNTFTTHKATSVVLKCNVVELGGRWCS